MDEERETGIGCMTALVLGIVIAVLALCSCGSRKTITEYVAVHDTLIVNHTDTISVERLSWRHDTIRVETERVVTLLQPSDKSLPADTIRVETNNWHWQKEVMRDSTSKVVAKVDSILRSLDVRHDKEKVKTKIPIEYIGYAAFLGVCAALCIWLLITMKKDS